MSTKHSPTPWTVGKYGSVQDQNDETVVVQGFALAWVGCHGPPHTIDRAQINREQIVHAVNAYEALVEALKLARRHAKHDIWCDFDETRCDCWLAQVDAALKLAKES